MADDRTETERGRERRGSLTPRRGVAARPSGGDAIIGAALEGLRRAAHEVEVERSVTATLQHSLLRERLPEIPGMSFSARYLPGSAEAEIGGDWYDVIPLRDGKAGAAIGDVVGRGIAAAARMAHLQSAVRAYALEGLRPSVVLERTDAFAQELERRGMATMLYAVLDPEAGTLRFASAGHPPPLILTPGRRGRSSPRAGRAARWAPSRSLPTRRASSPSSPARSSCSTRTAWSSVRRCRSPRASRRSPRPPPA